MGFEALKASPHRTIVVGHDLGVLIGSDTSVIQSNVVVVLVHKCVDGEAVFTAAPSQACIELVGPFHTQTGVTHLVGIGGHMYPIGKQFVVLGCALGAGHMGQPLPAWGQLVLQAQRGAQRCKRLLRCAVADGTATQTPNLGLFAAHTQCPTAPGFGQFFVHIQRLILGFAERRIGFIPACLKARRVALQSPHPLHASQRAAPRAVPRLQAVVGAGRDELGFDHTAVQFGMAVIGAGHLQVQAFNKSTRPAPLTFQGIARAAHVDGDQIFGHRPILAGILRHRGPQAAMVPKQTGPHRTTTGAVARVTNHPAGHAGAIAL